MDRRSTGLLSLMKRVGVLSGTVADAAATGGHGGKVSSVAVASESVGPRVRTAWAATERRSSSSGSGVAIAAAGARLRAGRGSAGGDAG